MNAWTRIAPLSALTLVLVGVLATGPAVFGQAAADAPQKVAAPAEEAAGSDSILSLIMDSGLTGMVFFGVLLLFSMVAATVAIERAVNTRRIKVIPPAFMGEFDQLVRRDEASPTAFRELCARWSGPVANILSAGLVRCGRPLVEVEKTMEDAAAREMSEIRSSIRPLSVVGSIAPLVGLLGTVVGMIIAFRTASQAGLGKGELLAQGIYMALVTTAAGLTIAIPCLLLAAFFNAKVDRFFREIDQHLMNAMPCFARMEHGEQSIEHATAPVPLSEPAT